MKYWTRDEMMAGADLPPDLEDIVVAVIGELDREAGQYPRIARVGAREDDDDDKEFFFELDLELAPGLTLPSYCGFVEFVLEDHFDDDVEFHFRTVMEGVPICLSQRERLEETIHDARSRARREIASQNRAGIATRLLDVTLSPYDHWRGQSAPLLMIRIEGPGPGIKPLEWNLQIENVDDLESEFAWLRDQLAAHSRIRADLLALGADARISQLALNVISNQSDQVEILRRFRSEDCLRLPDATALSMRNGCVNVGNGDPSSKYQWRENGVTVTSELIPDDVLAKVGGRSVTDLLQHPFLSPDMTIVSGSNSFVQGVPVVIIELTMPYHLFCASSGRVWSEKEPEVIPEPIRDNRVIPFRRREG